MQPKKTSYMDYCLLALLIIGGAYLALHLGNAFQTMPDKELPIVLELFLKTAEEEPFIFLKSYNPNGATGQFLTIYLSLAFVGIIALMTDRKKYLKGKEHGSAEWGKPKEAKLLSSKKEEENIILSEDVKMNLDTRATQRNLNVTIVGGSGAGKTRSYGKPNLMQVNTSFVVTDPKGELLRDTGKMLEEKGYKIKVFNLIDMKYSNNYSPFHYIDYLNKGNTYADKDIMKFINNLIKNTNGKGTAADPFWEKAERTLLMAITSYIYYELPKEEQHFGTIMEMIRCLEVKEDDEEHESILDILFQELESEKPEHIAVKYYKNFKHAAGKTAKSILISILARLNLFDLQQVVDLTSMDNIDIPSLGKEKTALFVIIPDSDDTFNCLVAMLYTQVFDILYNMADFEYQGRLPIHVRFILDEFANIGIIPNFEKLVATMRSREISVNIIIQNLSQLKTIYKDNWESIIGNCDSLVFLGGKEPASLEYVSKALGKTTIDTDSRNVSKSYRNSSTSHNEGILGRELLTPSELEKMPTKKCIVMVRGYNPFYGNKYNLKIHKNYKLLSDYSKENLFDYKTIETKEAKIVSCEDSEQGKGILIKEGVDYIVKDLEVTKKDQYLPEFEEEKAELLKEILGSDDEQEEYDERAL